MIFRNLGIKNENNILFLDDMLDENLKPLSAEIVENLSPLPKGKIITGTFGIFNIKEFEKMCEKLKKGNGVSDHD